MSAPPSETPPPKDPTLLKLFEEAFATFVRRKESMTAPERADLLVDELNLAVARFLGPGTGEGAEVAAAATVLITVSFQTLCARLGRPPAEVWTEMCSNAGMPVRRILLPGGGN